MPAQNSLSTGIQCVNRKRVDIMLKLIKSDLLRMFTSKRFFGAIIGITLVNGLNILQFIEEAFRDPCTLLNDASGAPFFRMIVLILAALPFSTSFCDDWENRYIRSIIIRVGTKKYALSKFICCFIGALLAGTLGLLLLVLITLPFVGHLVPAQNSLIMANASAESTGINWILSQHQYALWILAISFYKSLEGCVFAELGLVVSVKMTNSFLTLSMPVIGYYLYLSIINLLPDSDFLYTDVLDSTVINAAFLWQAVCFVVIAGVVLLCCFVRLVRRKVENE